MPTDDEAESASDFRTEAASAYSKQCGLFRPWQLGLLAFPVIALASLASLLWLQKPDYMSLLWRDPVGVKMLGAVVALLIVGTAAYSGGCLAINRLVARPGVGNTRDRAPDGACVGVARFVLRPRRLRPSDRGRLRFRFSGT